MSLTLSTCAQPQVLASHQCTRAVTFTTIVSSSLIPLQVDFTCTSSMDLFTPIAASLTPKVSVGSISAKHQWQQILWIDGLAVKCKLSTLTCHENTSAVLILSTTGPQVIHLWCSMLQSVNSVLQYANSFTGYASLLINPQ